MSSPFVHTACDGSVTTVTLNRPDKRNALNVELLEQLCTAIAAAEADPVQRILVLRGAARFFAPDSTWAKPHNPISRTVPRNSSAGL